MPADVPSPTGVMPRFTLLIEAMKRGLSEGIDQRHRYGGTPRDPHLQALLAASPRAGRLLRPLWHKLTPEPLPEVLRLRRKPARPRRPAVARPESPSVNPSPRPLVRSSRPKPLNRGEGEAARPASRYPVSLWPDPAPAVEPPASSPPGRRST
jgi:hypothetical protein